MSICSLLNGLGVPMVIMVAFLSCGSWGNLVTVFETNDPGTPTCGQCNTPTPTTGGCSCPAGSSVPQGQPLLRVLNTNCAPTDAFHGGHLGVCATTSKFGGFFQQDDATAHSLGCRSPNAQTGACSCPAGNVLTQDFRVVVDTAVPNDFIGSTITFCLGSPPADNQNTAGMYLKDTATGACLTGNPLVPESACSCGAGSPPSYTFQVVYPTASSALRNATWVVCAKDATTEICPGVTANLDGITDVTTEVLTCINQTAVGGTLLLPPGRYGVATQVAIRKPITLGTSGVALDDSRVCARDPSVGCATLVGLAACCTDGGILAVFSPGVVINHIIVDGNRDARRGSTSWMECLNNRDNRGNAVNARVSNAENTTFVFSASINALCASGFQWQGDACTIANSYFANNGNHADGRWSDGLTLLSCRNGSVHDLSFVDNTDVNLVCGCGAGFAMERIHITHISAASFAGFMFDNFDNSQCGDYRGAVARNITIECGNNQCDFGANFGPHPWYPSSNIVGGSVSYVTVSGAKQGVNCAGAGTNVDPLMLSNIVVVGSVPPFNTFGCGVHETSDFNIAPDSFVDTWDCPPNTSFAWKSCP